LDADDPAFADLQRRRRLCTALTALAALGGAGYAGAAARLLTPPQSLGPFYPDRLPLDDDSNLVQVRGAPAPAQGEHVEVAGRVTDRSGTPLAGVRVEIWQANAFGRYHHDRDRQDRPRDPGFQGYGQAVTRADGGYRFRTIRPVPYPGRAPHIHFRLTGGGAEPLVTQMYERGRRENRRDGLLNSISDPALRELLLVDFVRGTAGLPRAEFHLVLVKA